jgi:hypothetical protein
MLLHEPTCSAPDYGEHCNQNSTTAYQDTQIYISPVSHFLGEQQTNMSENRMIRKIFKSKKDEIKQFRILHQPELHD